MIATYRVKKDKERDLLAVLRDRYVILRREGFLTDRPACVLRGQDGIYLEILEWVSAEAIAAADQNEIVGALWASLERVAEYRRLAHLPESHELFAELESVDLEQPADNVIERASPALWKPDSRR
ncbi:MAG TPA: hypothetical protein VF789_23480 [Thermoanaerobaculia bacterium]